MPASLGAALSRDYLVVDDTQTVAYTSVRPGADLTVTLTSCDSHEFSAADRAVLSGLFQSGDRQWSLPGDQLAAAGIEPKDGDRLVDAAGVAWTITGACTLDDLGISWVCGSARGR